MTEQNRSLGLVCFPRELTVVIGNGSARYAPPMCGEIGEIHSNNSKKVTVLTLFGLHRKCNHHELQENREWEHHLR